ncbi:MAG: TlpA family protein disulfide reductase [Acidobacteriota bacterium]
MQSGKRVLLPTWASSTMMLLAAGAVGFLIWSLADQNRDLKRALAQGLDSAQAAHSMSAGDRIPSIRTVDLEGIDHNLSEITEAGGVVAFFTTSCPYCEETLPSWSELHSDLAARDIAFVALSLQDSDRTREYATSHTIHWPVWSLVDRTQAAALAVTRVPTTALVAPGGLIIELLAGVLGRDDIETIRARAIDLMATSDSGELLDKASGGCCR